MLRFITKKEDSITIEKKFIVSENISKKLNLQYFLNNNLKIDLSILNSEISLILINYFVKSVPKKVIYFNRILEELSFLQEEYFIELFLTLIKIRKILNNKKYILDTNFNKLLISYLMNLSDIDPINININSKDFKKNNFFIEVSLSDTDITCVKELHNKLSSTDRLHIYFNSQNKIKNCIKERLPDLKINNTSSFFRKINNQNLNNFINISKKKNIKNIDNKIVVNISINFNLILNLISHIPDYKDNNYKIIENDFLGIPLLEDRKFYIYWNYLNENNHVKHSYKDISNLMILGKYDILECIKFLNQKCNKFYENYLIFISKKGRNNLDYIRNNINCNIQEANIFLDAFDKNKLYMKGVFLENLKKNKNLNRKFIKEIYKNLEEDSHNGLIQSIQNENTNEQINKFLYKIIDYKNNNPLDFYLIILNKIKSNNLNYRKWVYYRTLLNHNISLNVGHNPWKIENNTLISYFKYQDYKNNIINFKNYGFWISKIFLKNMYLNKDNNSVIFRGLIASSKKYQLKNDIYSWVIIGYDNNKFIDLIIKGEHSFDKMDCISGEGILNRQYEFEWIIPSKFENSFLL